jgi:ribosomal protein L7Ae-like RNA K-turn-binding protein
MNHHEAAEPLLGLLGLARRAGKMALGAAAVERAVKLGQKPLVILARDAGPAQRRKVLRWRSLAGIVADVLDQEQLARFFNRQKLVIAAVMDQHFIAGIVRLGIVGGCGPDANPPRPTASAKDSATGQRR